jgi:hypothetical protein
MSSLEQRKRVAPYVRSFNLEDGSLDLLNDPTVPSEIFDVIWEWRPTLLIAQRLAASPRCPARLITQWLQEFENDTFSWDLLACPQLSPALLKSQYEQRRERGTLGEMSQLLRNPHLPVSVMREAIRDQWGAVLFSNPTLPRKIWQQLMASSLEPEQNNLRAAVAGRKDASPALLEAIFEVDSTVKVKRAIAGNPAIPNSVSRSLCLDADPYVLSELWSNDNVPFHYSLLAGARRHTLMKDRDPLIIFETTNFTWRENSPSMIAGVQAFEAEGGTTFDTESMTTRREVLHNQGVRCLFRRVGEPEWTLLAQGMGGVACHGKVRIPEGLDGEFFVGFEGHNYITVFAPYSLQDGTFHWWDNKVEAKDGLIPTPFSLSDRFEKGPQGESVQPLWELMNGVGLFILWGNLEGQPRGWTLAPDGDRSLLGEKDKPVFTTSRYIQESLESLSSVIREFAGKQLSL